MKINLGKTELIHFVGIGGIGMSGLALIMDSLGFKIQGSDISDNKYLNNLRKRKIPIFLKHNKKNIKVISFDNLTINLCKKFKAGTIIRGLRAVSDFEYEFQLAGMNKKLNSNIETMFLMSDVENQIISSKFVKEIANLGGNIDRFVTKSTVKVLKNNF